MRFRTLVVTVVAAGTLATGTLSACSSSGGGSGSTTTPPSTPATSAPATTNSSAAVAAEKVCADMRDVGTQINSLTSKANDPAALKEALKSAGTFLTTLKNEAPAALAPVMQNLSSLFDSAQQALSNPQKPDLSKLAVLATKVPADAQKIATWVQQNCTAGASGSPAAS